MGQIKAVGARAAARCGRRGKSWAAAGGWAGEPAVSFFSVRFEIKHHPSQRKRKKKLVKASLTDPLKIYNFLFSSFSRIFFFY